MGACAVGAVADGSEDSAAEASADALAEGWIVPAQTCAPLARAGADAAADTDDEPPTAAGSDAAAETEPDAPADALPASGALATGAIAELAWSAALAGPVTTGAACTAALALFA